MCAAMCTRCIFAAACPVISKCCTTVLHMMYAPRNLLMLKFVLVGTLRLSRSVFLLFLVKYDLLSMMSVEFSCDDYFHWISWLERSRDVLMADKHRMAILRRVVDPKVPLIGVVSFLSCILRTAIVALVRVVYSVVGVSG